MDITAVLAQYMHDVTADALVELTADVDAYLEVVRQAAAERDFVDVRLAEQIVAALNTLIADAAVYTAKERSLLAGAVRYFTNVNDENRDLTSPTGFDDDAEVLNAVCTYLGRGELSLHLS